MYSIKMHSWLPFMLSLYNARNMHYVRNKRQKILMHIFESIRHKIKKWLVEKQ